MSWGNSESRTSSRLTEAISNRSTADGSSKDRRQRALQIHSQRGRRRVSGPRDRAVALEPGDVNLALACGGGPKQRAFAQTFQTRPPPSSSRSACEPLQGSARRSTVIRPKAEPGNWIEVRPDSVRARRSTNPAVSNRSTARSVVVAWRAATCARPASGDRSPAADGEGLLTLARRKRCLSLPERLSESLFVSDV
jgi:hypothetical protein